MFFNWAWGFSPLSTIITYAYSGRAFNTDLNLIIFEISLSCTLQIFSMNRFVDSRHITGAIVNGGAYIIFPGERIFVLKFSGTNGFHIS